MNYESVVRTDSKVCRGVNYAVAKMSFGRRVQLMRAVKEAAEKLEFYAAGSSETDKMSAGLLSAEVDRIYVRWGLLEVSGLSIDGEAATAETLTEAGPEDLFREALGAVKHECGLSEEEKKT